MATDTPITLTKEQLKEMLRQAWWQGHGTSRHDPSPNGAAKCCAKELVKDLEFGAEFNGG